MSRCRLLGWLLAACVFLAGVHAFLYLNGARTGRILRRMVLAPLADGATEVSVLRDGVKTVLSKASGSWRIAEPFSAEAEQQVVLRLLDALAFAPVEEVMSESELAKLGRDRRDFMLQTPRIMVEALGVHGSVRIAFGSATPAGDGVYAMVDGVRSVFIVGTNVLSSADMSADGFRRRAVFDSMFAEAQAFDVKRGKGAFMRVLRTREGWRMVQPADSPVSAERVGHFLDGLSKLKAQSFVWPSGATNEPAAASLALLSGFGLDSDNAVTVSVRFPAGSQQTVSFGKSAGAGLVYALVQNGSAVVTLDSSVRARIVAETDAFVDSRLFPLKADAIDTLLLADGDERILLAKNGHGDWRLDEPVAAPADSDAVASLLARVVTLRAEDRDPAGIRVSVASNMPSVSVSREAILSCVSLVRLRSLDVMAVAPVDVRRVVLSPFGGGSVSVIRGDAERDWHIETSPVPGVADSEAVEELVAALNPLRALSVEKLRARAADLGSYGLETPRWVISVDSRREGDVRRNLLIGDKTVGGRYATLGATDAVFVLPEATVERLIRPLVRE